MFGIDADFFFLIFFSLLLVKHTAVEPVGVEPMAIRLSTAKPLSGRFIRELRLFSSLNQSLKNVI